MHPLVSRRLGPFAPSFLIGVGICGAFAMAWFTKAPRQLTQRPPSQVIHTFSPSQILDQLPIPTGTSLIQKSLAAAIAKTHSLPSKPENWVLVAELLAQFQRDSSDPRYYAAAESAYQQALRLDPQSIPAIVGMAWVTGGRHQFDQSIAWAQRALINDPECIPAFGILGDADLELGDYESAFQHYQKMMDLRPDLSSWSRGAHLLWVTGDSRKAIRLMQKAIDAGAPFAENTAWCRAKMATMLFAQGAILPAQDIIDPCLSVESSNVHILLIAAQLAEGRRDFDQAASYYQTILTSRPHPEALAALGDLETTRGNLAAAEIYYQKVEALHQDLVASGGHDHSFMARFYADHDRNLIEALRMAEEHKLTKNVHEADTLAWVYFKNGLLPQAIKAMELALSQHTLDPETHYHAGLIAQAQGDLSAARKHLNKALNMNPHFSLRQAPLALAALEKLSPAPSNLSAGK